jgi:hypothetical protein
LPQSGNNQWWNHIAVLNASEVAQPLRLSWNRKCKVCGIKVRLKLLYWLTSIKTSVSRH